MKLLEIIYFLKEMLAAGPVSKDFDITDRQLYYLLKVLRSTLIEQKSNKFKHISDQSYQSIDCLELKISQIPDCPCITLDCLYLKSVIDLPLIVSSRNNLLLNVSTMYGKKINHIRSLDELEYRKDRRYTKESYGYLLHNNKLVIVDPKNMLEKVSIKAVFYDPVEIANVSGCGINGNSPCYDPLNSNFPIDSDLIKYIHDMTYEEILKVFKSISPDTLNNANDDTSWIKPQRQSPQQ